MKRCSRLLLIPLTVVPCLLPTVMGETQPPLKVEQVLQTKQSWDGAIFGGLTPLFVAWLLRSDRLAPANYVGVLCLLGVAIGVFLVAFDKQGTPSPADLFT